jgi:hypothetical protein
MDGITGHMMDTILRWTFREWIFLVSRTDNGWQTTSVSGGGGLVCPLQFALLHLSVGGRFHFWDQASRHNSMGCFAILLHIFVYFFYTLFL